MQSDNTLLALLSQVALPDGCWEWRAGRSSGYGVVRIGGRKVYAHRAMYELVFGPLPDDACVLHKCDNPPCIRPDHLFDGSRDDNMQDMIAKGRARHPGQKGTEHPQAKLTDADVLTIRAATGVTQRELAERYGVTQTLISMIRRGKIWTHL